MGEKKKKTKKILLASTFSRALDSKIVFGLDESSGSCQTRKKKLN